MPGTLFADDGDTDPLRNLRAVYFEAVQEGPAIDTALREVERIRTAQQVRDGSRLDTTLRAYEGALITLRAKHGTWPPRRLQHMREGLALLDDAVADDPDNPEARYLRLMSCYYLPGILGRNGSVREDFAALARLLPSAQGSYPGDLYRAIATFVLENGRLEDGERGPLERSLSTNE